MKYIWTPFIPDFEFRHQARQLLDPNPSQRLLNKNYIYSPGLKTSTNPMNSIETISDFTLYISPGRMASIRSTGKLANECFIATRKLRPCYSRIPHFLLPWAPARLARELWNMNELSTFRPKALSSRQHSNQWIGCVGGRMPQTNELISIFHRNAVISINCGVDSYLCVLWFVISWRRGGLKPKRPKMELE